MGTIRYTFIDYFYSFESNFDTIEEELEDRDNRENGFDGISEIYGDGICLDIEQFKPNYNIGEMYKEIENQEKDIEEMEQYYLDNYGYPI